MSFVCIKRYLPGSYLLLLALIYSPQSICAEPLPPVTLQEQDVVLFAEAIRDKKRNKATFTSDLIRKGMLPVKVAIANNSTDETLLVRVDEIKVAKLSHGDVSTSALTELGGVTKFIMRNPLTVVSPASFMLAGRSVNKAAKLERALLVHQLRTQTVDPGKKIGGYILVPIKKGARDQSVGISIPLLTLDETPAAIFELTL